MLAENRVGFELGAYDRDRELVIDPLLDYLAMIGSTGPMHDTVGGLGVDADGSAVFCGFTSGTSANTNDLPVTQGSYDSTWNGGGPNVKTDGFVGKLLADGSLAFLSYLGGSHNEEARDCGVDPNGAIYVTGITASNDFPTAGAFQANHGGGVWDAFVSKLSADGRQLLYSSYLGGPQQDRAWAMAVDPSGAAYLTGDTKGAFYTVEAAPGGFDKSFNGGTVDAWAAKVRSDGSGLEWGTYLGGNDQDGNQFGDIAADPDGNAYVVGFTRSTNFPTGPGQVVQNSDPPSDDGFLVKIGPAGGLVYSTYLGSGMQDTLRGVAADAEGNAYVTGYFRAADFPGYEGPAPYKRGFFVSKIDPEGQNVIYTARLGEAEGHSVAVNSAGQVAVCGVSYAAWGQFPEIDALQAGFIGALDYAVVKLDASGTPTFSTLLGGDNDSGFCRVGIDDWGNVYGTGGASPNLPHATAFYTPGGQHTTLDGLVFRIGGFPEPPPPPGGGGGQPGTMHFDGTGKVLVGDVDALDGLQVFTGEAWVKFDSNADFQRVFSKVMTDNKNGFDVLTYQGRIDFNPMNDANVGVHTSSGTLVTDTWMHIAVVYDGTKTGNLERAKIYLNGVEASTGSFGEIPSSLPSTTAPLYLGAWGNGGYNLQGQLDEVRLWNVKLTPEGIQAGMNCELTGTEEGLVAYYNFNSGADPVEDGSGNGHQGTAQGGATAAPPGAPVEGQCGPLPPPEPVGGGSPPGLVAHFAGEGNALDSVGGNDGVAAGGVSFVSGSGGGQAFSFDGVPGSYVEVADDPALKPETLTVEAWLRGPEPAGIAYFVEKGGNGCGAGISYALARDDSGLYFGLRLQPDVRRWAFAGHAVFDGNWHHVAGTWDGTAPRIYVDGSLVGTGGAAAGPIYYDYVNVGGTNNLRLGSFSDSGCQGGLPARIDLDEVKIYDRALSAEEILAAAQAGGL